MISQQTQDKAYGVFKSLASRAKQYAMNLSEIELKTEEATNNEAWGPTGSQMSEITKECYDSESFKQIMGVLARRLQDKEEDWRHVYKSLLLLEYMAKHGPQKVVDELVSNINVIEKLQQFQYKDKNGRDWGLNVRQRAKEVAGLVSNSERIRSERAKAKANESKYTGVSSDDMRAGGGFRNKAAYSSGGSYGGLGGSGGFSSSSARIDDDDESQLHIKADSPDKSKSLNDAITETQKRIAALKHDSGTPTAAADESSAAAEPVRLRAALQPARPREAPLPEAKAPKRLSEFRVNPNIAAAFGGPGTKLPAPGGSLLSAPPAAAAAPAPAASAADLLGGLDHPAASSQGVGEADVWSNFADSRNTGSSTAQSISAGGGGDGGFDAAAFGGSDPFGAPPAAAPQPQADPFASTAAPRSQSQPAASRIANADPFAAMAQPARPSPVQSADPFAATGLSGPSQAPAKPPAPPSSDPFTSLGGPTPAPQSPMVAASPKGFPSAGNAGGASGTPKSGMLGQALPEDMFSMPMQQPQAQAPGRGQQLPMGFAGSFGGASGGAQFSGSPHATSSPHARPGYSLQQPGYQQPSYQQQQGFQQAQGYPQPQAFQQGFQQPQGFQQQSFQQGFGSQAQPFGQAQQPYGQPSFQAQDPFGVMMGGPSISVGQADFSSASPQHVSLPAAPAKKDPFAGLAGF